MGKLEPEDRVELIFIKGEPPLGREDRENCRNRVPEGQKTLAKFGAEISLQTAEGRGGQGDHAISPNVKNVEDA